MALNSDKAAADYRRKKKDMPLSLGDVSAYDTKGRIGTGALGPRSQVPPQVQKDTMGVPRGEPPVAEYKPAQMQTPAAQPAPAQQPLQRTPMDLRQSSRADAVRNEMLARQIVREKQTPFVTRDAGGNIDPRVVERWALNDKKFATDRAVSLSTPQKLGTAAGARATDQAALDELMRQREAEANRKFPSITGQPSFNAAVQYRDPALQEEAFNRAKSEYGDTTHKAVAESGSRLSDLDRRIAEYKARVAQPYNEPVPSETARMDQLARRDAYIAEAGKVGERIDTDAAYQKSLENERRAAAIRGEQLRNREDPQQELARAMVGTETDKIKSGRVAEEYQQGLGNAAMSPEGLANLGAQTIEGIFQSVSDNGSVTGTGAFGDAKNALGLSRMLRDQVVGNLEKLRSNPTARANALAFKNQLETKLGTSTEFKPDISFFTAFVDQLLPGENSTKAERQELAATLNDVYKRLSDLASEQQ